MKNPSRLLAVLLAATLSSCSSGAEESAVGPSDEVPEELDSATTSAVEDGVRLEFRIQEYIAEATEDCIARNPDTDGLTTAIAEGADEPTIVCRSTRGAEGTGAFFEVGLSSAIVTGEHVKDIGVDYGTDGLPRVYVVLDEEGVTMWRTETEGVYDKVEMLVDGRPLPAPAAEIGDDDILSISGAITIEDAREIAWIMAYGFDA